VTVALVGAGPGDPGLLTVRGAELLGRAEIVFYDSLAEASLLSLAPDDAEKVFVGKRPGAPMDQEEINALLVEHGRAGRRVVRLKGGDPFVFGRGGEEALALQAAGVPFEIVPGITSAVAVPAYAGIPVTHRGLSTSFSVVTGHSRHEADAETDWASLARAGGTIIVLMGVAHRAAIAERLQESGMPPDTPVAAVCWGTRPEQRTVRTTLAGLGAVALEPPATIVIGAVAGLRLDWWETRPLFGHRVLVTRTREQASGLAGRLAELGASVVELPTIEIADPADGGVALREAAAAAGTYDWVVFTSGNAVERFMACLRDARAFGTARVGAIGGAPAAALVERGVRADLIPERAVGEALVEVFPDGPGRVLLPRAAIGREVVPDGLRAKGWTVEVVEAYRTVPAPAPSGGIGHLDAVTFTSASTVEAFLALDLPVPPVVACIGPITARTAEARGLRVDVVAEEASVGALAEALARRIGS
jgi:uroporphyrinogen III methyltransferase/synthase